MKRDPVLAEWDHAPGIVTYRCTCRRLVKGPLGLERTRHEECGTGTLTTQARVTRAMLEAHEIAGLIDGLDEVSA